MPNKKEKTKNYIGLSLSILGISVIVLFMFLGLGFLVNGNLDSLSFKIVLILIQGSFGIVVLSLTYFFVSVIYNQFRDKRILWGITDILLLIFFLLLWVANGNFALILGIVFASCFSYYFSYIVPNLKKKKLKRELSRRKR